MKMIGFKFEKTLQAEGFNLIAGLDEAGRGAWAGPVYAGAVIFNWNRKIVTELNSIQDSKLLTPQRRETFFDLIKKEALAVGIGSVGHQEIDRIGIRDASLQAMKLALENIEMKPEFVLIDGFELQAVQLPQKGIIKGDQKIFSIAAASIIAKVSRDREMRKLDQKYPGYGFARHKGYGVKFHQEQLEALGPCEIHRKSYRPIQRLKK